MIKRRRRKCRHCGALFRPDPRNLRHQHYCSQGACRRASKAASQRRWLAKSCNRHYFCGSENVARVRAWRAAHPGYWRQRGPAPQEVSSAQCIESARKTAPFAPAALQEIFDAQPFVLMGLIAQLTGAALQEDIARTARRLHSLAQDILNTAPERARPEHVP